jgi:hypothetical protein
MALTLKSAYEVTKVVDKIRVKDKTGAYSASNTGGWGAPNLELADVALWATVIRKASTGDEYLEPVLTNFVRDAAAENADESVIEFKYKNDGVIEVYLGYLNVSEDGINYIDDTAIEDGDFVYYADDGKYIWRMEDGELVEATIEELIENDDIVTHELCEDIVAARLAVQAQKDYKKYRLQRIKEVDDAEPLYDELQKLFTDIQGAYYTFYSGLKVECQSQIESLLDEYQLVNT